MTVGLSVYGLPIGELLELAVVADEVGFDAIWLGEHVVLPIGYASEHPGHTGSTEQHHTGPIVDPQTELPDQWVALAAVAARTTRLRLATGIHLLPLRHPLLTAKATTTLQELSGGRLLLGVGAGWLREEFDALGVRFTDRYRLLEDSIDLLRAAWVGEPFEQNGTPVLAHPRPVTVPVVLGGNSDAALARAARLGDAWFSSGTPTFDDAVALCHHLRRLRPDSFRCYVRIPEPDPALVDRYRAAGVDDVVVWADQLWTPGSHGNRDRLAAAADALGLSPARGWRGPAGRAWP